MNIIIINKFICTLFKVYYILIDNKALLIHLLLLISNSSYSNLHTIFIHLKYIF